MLEQAKPVVRVKEKSQAEYLQSLLTAKGISCFVEPCEGQYAWQVSVHNAARQAEAVALLRSTLSQQRDKKNDELWQQASPAPITIDWGFKSHNIMRLFQQAPFMLLIFVLCIISFLASSSLWFEPVMQALSFRPWHELIQTGQWWRILGPTLLHFSLLHIVFNLMWWYVLGRGIEQRFGSMMLLILYVVSGVLSNAAQFWDTGIYFGGLSGVVYALFGFVWWIGWLKPHWQMSLPNSLIGFMLMWLVLGYTDVIPVNMANTAHLVGLLSGCIMAWIVTRFEKSYS